MSMIGCMLISHERRFIFIHVSKAAGTSVQRALQPYAALPPSHMAARRALRLLGVNHWGPAGWRVYREHASARTIRAHMPRGRFEQYFSFAFVRNPWDWMVSLYAYLLNTPSHRHHERIVAMSGLREYIEFEIGRGKRSQHEFICDQDGRVMVDYVGRFESLQEHFADVCRHLGVAADLPHVNGSAHRDYRRYYKDHATINLVAEHFQKDIELLGYTFEGPVSAAVSMNTCRQARVPATGLPVIVDPFGASLPEESLKFG